MCYCFKVLDIFRLVIVVYGLLCGCSTDNLADSYFEKSRDAEAKLLLEDEKFDEAITLYHKLVNEEPLEYSRFPLYSAAYAGRAGVSVFGLVKEQFSNTRGGQGVLDTVGGYIPESPTDSQIEDISRAIGILGSLPIEHRSVGSSYEYAAGAAFQYTLYLSASSVMIINKYKSFTASNSIDRVKLEEISDQEVDYILDNFTQVISSSPDTSSGKILSDSVSAVLNAVNATDGSSRKEKLLNYLERNPT